MINETNKTNVKTVLLKLDEKLHKQLKINAINKGITLHDYLIKKLTE